MVVAALLLSAPLDIKAILDAPIPVLEARWGKASHWATWGWKGRPKDIPTFASVVAFSTLPKARWKRDEFGICWQNTPGLLREGIATVSIEHPDDDGKRFHITSVPVAGEMDAALKRLYRIFGLEGPEHTEWVRSRADPVIASPGGEWYGRLSTHPTSEGKDEYVLRAHYDRLGPVCVGYRSDNDGDDPSNVWCDVQLDPAGEVEYVHYVSVPATTMLSALQRVGIDTRALKKVPMDTLFPLSDHQGWSFAWRKGSRGYELELERDEQCEFHSGVIHCGSGDVDGSEP